MFHSFLLRFHNLLRFVTFCRILRTSSFPVKLTCRLANYFGNVANAAAESIEPADGIHRYFLAMAIHLIKWSLMLQVEEFEGDNCRILPGPCYRMMFHKMVVATGTPASQQARTPASRLAPTIQARPFKNCYSWQEQGIGSDKTDV